MKTLKKKNLYWSRYSYKIIYLVVSDGDLVLLASRLVAGGDVEDAVSVDVEGDLDLGHSAGCRRDSGKVKLTKQMVVFGHSSLTLVHLDGDGGLVVAVGGEGLGLLRRDGRVPLDQGGHHPT